jgi:hypothetical protein
MMEEMERNNSTSYLYIFVVNASDCDFFLDFKDFTNHAID